MADVRDLLPPAQKPRLNIRLEPKARTTADLTVYLDRPWEHLKAVLYDKGIAVLSRPDDGVFASTSLDAYGHNCDQMGCGTQHVIMRIELPEELRAPIRELLARSPRG